MNKSYMVTIWDSLTFESSVLVIELENPPSKPDELAHAVHEGVCKTSGERAEDWEFCGVLGGNCQSNRTGLIEQSAATEHTTQPAKMAAVWKSVQVFAGGTRTLSAECFVELR